jgi:hypothetical protein
MRCINRLILSSSFVLVSQCEPKQKPGATSAYPTPILIDNTLIKTKLTVLRLFSPTGEQVRQFIYTRGLGAFWVRQRHFILYPPVFATTGSRTG